jgi:hypothetical protein
MKSQLSRARDGGLKKAVIGGAKSRTELDEAHRLYSSGIEATGVPRNVTVNRVEAMATYTLKLLKELGMWQ